MVDLIVKESPYAIQKNHIQDILNLFIKITEQQLISGNKVKIRNIGTLLIKERKAFQSILPNQNKLSYFNSKKSVKFIPSKNLNSQNFTKLNRFMIQ